MLEIILNCIIPLILTAKFTFIAKELKENKNNNKAMQESVVLLLRSQITGKCENLFGKYLTFGIIFQLGFQALLNLMVVVGLIPVTGVTLPFLSYGGSSLLITLVSIGIILNVSRHQK